ncbi:MAG TPA: transcriptional regulator [Pseudonocardiaceae bacterium]|nr:transcriptional regulator [Pseudonocardiaceae bacterium]
MNTVDELAAVALLAEPVRRRLYEYVRDRHSAVGRDEAAEAVGISRKLAAFHLDRLADVHLLAVDYRRLSGRVGPGAGRPAKLYTVSPRRFAVTVPQTGYVLAAAIMATALSSPELNGNGRVAVERVATEVGERLGRTLRAEHRGTAARRGAVERTLAELGFQPHQRGCELVLGNCIFAELAETDRDLICALNKALVSGMLAGAELTGLRAASGSIDGGLCCARLISA